jgi:uncharacterized membrane protein YcaP (DUF421 family)
VDFINLVWQVVLRMVLIFAVALLVVRLMGNRTVGQFSPFDFVLMVGIGDIVGNVALEGNESFSTGVAALIGIFLLQQTLSRLSLKSKLLRKWFEGKPVAIIQEGKIVRENLTKTQFNYDDLRQELHKQGLDFTNLKDIKVARLESSGDFSVIMTPDVEPLRKRDLEHWVESLAENPLSPEGGSWSKLEQLAADVQVLADYVRAQQTAARRQEGTVPQTGKNLH